MRMTRLTDAQARGFYAVPKERPSSGLGEGHGGSAHRRDGARTPVRARSSLRRWLANLSRRHNQRGSDPRIDCSGGGCKLSDRSQNPGLAAALRGHAVRSRKSGFARAQTFSRLPIIVSL